MKNNQVIRYGNLTPFVDRNLTVKTLAEYYNWIIGVRYFEIYIHGSHLCDFFWITIKFPDTENELTIKKTKTIGEFHAVFVDWFAMIGQKNNVTTIGWTKH